MQAKYDPLESHRSEVIKKNKIVAEIPREKHIEQYSEESDTQKEPTLGFYNLLQKHENINEMGIFKNIELRKSYMLPLIDSSKKLKKVTNKKRTAPVQIGKSCDKAVSVIPPEQKAKKSKKINEG